MELMTGTVIRISLKIAAICDLFFLYYTPKSGFHYIADIQECIHILWYIRVYIDTEWTVDMCYNIK